LRGRNGRESWRVWGREWRDFRKDEGSLRHVDPFYPRSIGKSPGFMTPSKNGTTAPFNWSDSLGQKTDTAVICVTPFEEKIADEVALEFTNFSGVASIRRS
jgi:hypothetical protein